MNVIVGPEGVVEANIGSWHLSGVEFYLLLSSLFVFFILVLLLWNYFDRLHKSRHPQETYVADPSCTRCKGEGIVLEYTNESIFSPEADWFRCSCTRHKHVTYNSYKKYEYTVCRINICPV